MKIETGKDLCDFDDNSSEPGMERRKQSEIVVMVFSP
jgi:hypothetical protein